MEANIQEDKRFNMPRIGDDAPSFTANTTQGKIDFPKAYEGHWVIFFSHPADFTPVCTSEFITFASMEEEFSDANCRLIGLSIDSIYSHIAWLRDINELIEYEGLKNIEIHFPLIEDISMDISKQYGMIMPGESITKAVRSVFLIDPKGTIRAIIYYPLSVGRNFNELYRLLMALKTTDEFNVATPANWHPGKKVIIPPPETSPEAKDRVLDKEEGVECKQWFFCTKELDQQTINEKVLRR